MINGISAQGKHMYIHGGHTGNPYVNMNNPSAGMMRFDGNNMQVYDGSSWLTMSGSIASVGMNGQAESAIDWAIEQMTKEAEYAELAKKSKAVKLALEKVELAKAELKILAELARTEYEETTT